jgi:hypothetical protein
MAEFSRLCLSVFNYFTPDFESFLIHRIRSSEPKEATFLPGRCPEEMAPDGAVVRLPSLA